MTGYLFDHSRPWADSACPRFLELDEAMAETRLSLENTVGERDDYRVELIQRNSMLVDAERERDAALADLKQAKLGLAQQRSLLASGADRWRDRYEKLLEKYEALSRVALLDALPGRAEREDHYRSWRELRDTLDVARDTIARAHALYVRRCAETMDNFTEGEELFLADLSGILDPIAKATS